MWDLIIFDSIPHCRGYLGIDNLIVPDGRGGQMSGRDRRPSAIVGDRWSDSLQSSSSLSEKGKAAGRVDERRIAER